MIYIKVMFMSFKSACMKDSGIYFNYSEIEKDIKKYIIVQKKNN